MERGEAEGEVRVKYRLRSEETMNMICLELEKIPVHSNLTLIFPIQEHRVSRGSKMRGYCSCSVWTSWRMVSSSVQVLNCIKIRDTQKYQNNYKMLSFTGKNRNFSILQEDGGKRPRVNPYDRKYAKNSDDQTDKQFYSLNVLNLEGS